MLDYHRKLRRSGKLQKLQETNRKLWEITGNYGKLRGPLVGSLGPGTKKSCLLLFRLSNSYIKVKHVLQEVKERERSRPIYPHHHQQQPEEDIFNSFQQKALGGFVFVLAEDGQCLYMSQNVSEFLGLQQLDLMGHR